MIKAIQYIEKSFFGAVSFIMTYGIQRKLRALLPDFKEMIKKYDLDMDRVLNRCRTLRELDQHFSSKIFGFKGADDYYKKVGCQQLI